MTARLFSQIYHLVQRQVLIKAVNPTALGPIMPGIVNKEKKKTEIALQNQNVDSLICCLRDFFLANSIHYRIKYTKLKRKYS